MSQYSASKPEQPIAFAVLSLDGSTFNLDASRFSELQSTLPTRAAMTRMRGGDHVSLWLDGAWRKVPMDKTQGLIEDLNRLLAEDICSQIDQFKHRI